MVGNKCNAPHTAIRTNTAVSEPKVGKRRRLHLDLLGSAEENRHNLSDLSKKLDKTAPVSETKIGLTLSSENEFLAKYAEMMGHLLSYQITHKSPNHTAADSYEIATEIIRRLGVPVIREGDATQVVIPNRAHISYNRFSGVISESSNPLLVGRDCLDYIACNVHEDLAAVMPEKGVLVYEFDSSMYEKTPKNPRTGENMYIGKKFIDFHGAAKTYGAMLPEIFHKLRRAFSEGRLDVLTIDLRGGNVHTDGHTQVRRFERDHLVPIYDIFTKILPLPDALVPMQYNRVIGMLAFADVVFQREGDKLSPFEGGLYLDIDCPVAFSAKYKVKEAEAGNSILEGRREVKA